MTSPQDSPHTLNLTPERLDTARSWLRAHVDSIRVVSRSATVMAAVGLLICDDEGHIAEPAMLSAMRDPIAISTAETLLSEVLH